MTNTLLFSPILSISTEEKLAESSAANAALISQLESLNPQLSALEKALSTTKSKLEAESTAKREAELAQEEAEAKLREAEGSIEKLKAENEEAHEQLAFREEEVEEMRLELEVEKERHTVELEELAAQLQQQQKSNDKDGTTDKKDDSTKQTATKDDISVMTDDEDFVTMAVNSNDQNQDDQEDYIKRLEDELEDVTEQLIEAETNISNMEGKLSAAEKKKTELEEKITSLESNMEELQKASEEEKTKAMNEKNNEDAAKASKEELALLNEELYLTQVELKTAEQDSKTMKENFSNMEKEYKAKIEQLSKQLDEAKSGVSDVGGEVDDLRKALAERQSESDSLRDEVANLTQALNNAKADYEKTQEELDELRNAFDENEENIRQSSAAREEELIKLHKREIQDLQAELLAVQESNSAMKAANVKASGPSAAEVDLQSKLDSKQKELTRLKKDLEEERNENTKAKRKIEELSAGNRALIDGAMGTKSSANPQKLAKFASHHELQVEEEDEATSEFYRSHARSRHRYPHEPSKRARSSSPTTVVRLEREISTQVNKAKSLASECEELKSQKRMSDVRVNHLENDVAQLRKDVDAAEARSDNLVNVVASGISNPEARDDGEDLDGDIEEVLAKGTKEEIQTEVRALSRKATMQKEHNAQLLVKILKLQGNIQVCARVRPMTSSEIKSGTKRVVEPLSEAEIGVFDERTKNWKSFSFDKVWGPDSHQLGVFQDVEPLALSVVDGYNACIFAYGQT